jgi:AmmeMemoRadiSam system protein B/AmmeMemoRadiSam system protein A
MRKQRLNLVLILAATGLAVIIACSGSETANRTQEEAVEVRKPAVAGTFYPGKPSELREMVDGFLEKAAPARIDGEILSVIAPHAGYVYSGPVAAYAYAAIKGRSYDLVIIIGPSHRTPVTAAAVQVSGSFETPLGSVPIDEKIAKAIVGSSEEFIDDPGPHALEHSLEVQLPFLQRVLQDFKIVPIVTRDLSPATCEEMGRVLADCVKGRKVLLIGSTDLSHYPPYEDANKVDNETIESWKTMNLGKIYANEDEILQRHVRNLSCTMCGTSAVLITMAASKSLGADAITILKYMNSAAVSGDKTGVVGYAAAAMHRRSGHGAGTEAKSSKSETVLGRAERKRLLSVARGSIDAVLSKKPAPDFSVTEPILKEHRGAFVTLHRNGQLRGCIGRFVAEEPLYRVVSQMAVAAATQDRRFPAVTFSELADIDIEISVLSPLWKMSNIDELELGRHGIYIVKGMRTGCFLPQVADETGWSKEDFLKHCCADKAGLEPDAWKTGAEVYLFTAEVFSEKEVLGQ